MNKTVFCIACIFALFQGCSKNEPPPVAASGTPAKPVSLQDATSTTQAAKAVEQAKTSAAPKADVSVPLDRYQGLNSGKELMFVYLALSTMPVDYEKVARAISNDYRSQQDEFKKRDILNAMKPGIDKEIAKAKEQRYFYIDLNDQIDKYDFDAKSFPLPALANAESYRIFGDVGEYRLWLANQTNFSKFPVLNENQARNIENLRSKYAGLTSRVYFFAADTKLGESTVVGEVTKVRLLDNKGNVIANE